MIKFEQVRLRYRHGDRVVAVSYISAVFK